jgi:hypothetical protein
MCGDVKSKKDDKTDSRPLVTVSDLQKLKEEEAIILRSRMNPYKTKLKYDRKIDWGTKYKKADYPTREKSKVATFDLKGYVTAKRDKKINEMLGGQAPTFQPMGGMFGANPMPNNGLDVDNLVKRIDAQIAKLEAEEKAEQEKKKQSKQQTETIEKKEPIKKFDKEEVTDDQFFDDFFNDEE